MAFRYTYAYTGYTPRTRASVKKPYLTIINIIIFKKIPQFINIFTIFI